MLSIKIFPRYLQGYGRFLFQIFQDHGTFYKLTYTEKCGKSARSSVELSPTIAKNSFCANAIRTNPANISRGKTSIMNKI